MTLESQTPLPGELAIQPAESNAGSSVDASVLELANRIDTLVQTYTPTTGDGESVSPSGAEPASQSEAVSTVRRQSRAAVAELPVQHRLPDDLRQAKILIVDQDEEQVHAARHHLECEGFMNVRSTSATHQVVEEIRSEQPELILLAISTNDVSALDTLRDLSLASISVIALTAPACDPATRRQALEMGATDFLSKPFDPNELVPRVRNALIIKNQGDRIANEKSRFEQLLRGRTAEVEASREQLILSLARAAEHRDNETGNHVIRVGCFAGIIACELGWPDDRVEMLIRAAQLHDVGKIGVPDEILFKPGRLEPQEFEMIKRHCAWGKEIIQPFSDHELQLIKSHARVGEKILHVRHSPMLMLAARVAQTHHENWDGSGYPLGLAGEDIPLEGRITSVADVFDALSSKRPYKEAFPREKCFEILEESRGTKFDPRVLDAFFAQASRIVEVQLELMDDGDIRWLATR